MAGPVLVIDTDVHGRRALAAALQRGYFVTEILGRFDMDRLAAQARFADLVMLPATPEGHKALRKLRASEVGWTLPIAIHALGPLPEAAQIGWLEAGADTVLPEVLDNLMMPDQLDALIRYKRGNDRLLQALSGYCDPRPPPRRQRHPAPWDAHPVICFDPSGATGPGGGRPPIPGASLVTQEEDLLERLQLVPDAQVLLCLQRPACSETGLQLIPQIGADAARRFLPLLVHLDHGQETTAGKALALGASDAVVGPASPALLLARLRACDRRRHSAAEVQTSVLDQLRLTMVDPLSGLYNRRYVDQFGPAALTRSTEAAQPFALVMLDIDRFKQINDRHGHACGDRVISIVARRIARAVRAHDIAARMGGEEFLVVLPETGPRDAEAIAWRIRDAIVDRPIRTGIPGESVNITVSAGVSVLCPGERSSFLRALTLADNALYQSKAAGRDRISLSLCGTAA